MKANKVIHITLVLVFLLGATSAEAASSGSSTASQRWKVQLLKGGEDSIRNLSTAYVGISETPMLSYDKIGSPYIYRAYTATSAVPGNCGPNNGWYCNQWFISGLVPGTVSPMATWQKTADTHLVRWAFSTSTMIRGASLELNNNMSYVTSSLQDLIQLNKFGGTLVGSPSLQIMAGHYKIAATIRDNTDLYAYKLVYMTYASPNNTTCLDAGSNYQCDVIDSSNGSNSMGAPTLSMAANGMVGIEYSKAGTQFGLMYAYPHTSSSLYPSNCGTFLDPWRCISIFADVGTSTVGRDVKAAMGTAADHVGIAFTFGNASFGKYLFNASYVDSGGNCGTDLNFYGESVDKWNCKLIAFLGIPDRSYSIAIDPQEYSVIAFEYASTDQSPVDLYLTYPNARVGIASPGWALQRIDSAPTTLITTGGQAALSINNTGFGFIGYLQEEDYVLPDLKITWQQFETFLPLIKR
jgi:hypothetical protein